MLDVKKKKRPSQKKGRVLLLVCAVALLAAVCAASLWLNRPAEKIAVTTDHLTYEELAVHAAKDVTRLGITLRSGESWAAVQVQEGQLALEDDADYQVSDKMTADLLDAARVISFERVLTDRKQDYAQRLAEFGLEDPRVIADITYADGSRWVLRIGDVISLDEGNAYYMTIDGDDRLFALDKGTAEALMVERALLHPVTQPVLHKARFDRISFADGEGHTLAEWTLQGDIGGNAQDRWLLTSPMKYPADGESIRTLQENIENLRLGAYVGEATPEALTACGFDAPRLILTVHQAAGAMGSTGADGVYSVTDWPEDTFTLVVGGAKNDMVDYVLVDGAIYISSHFTLDVLMDMDPAGTVSRYAVPVALGNLRRLTIAEGGEERIFTLTRTERVAANNDLETDTDGNVLYDVTCDLNGAELPYAAFEAAYNELLKVTVSGSLPKGWTAEKAPHTTYRFEAVTGETYTLALAAFDAMHDALLLDGNALFYLIRGGMAFGVE